MIEGAMTPADYLSFNTCDRETWLIHRYHHTPKRVPKWPAIRRKTQQFATIAAGITALATTLPPTSATYPSTAQLSESTANLSLDGVLYEDIFWVMDNFENFFGVATYIGSQLPQLPSSCY